MKNTLFSQLKKVFLASLFGLFSMISAHAADTLVLYYSLSGNTSIVAEELQKILDADIVRIETQEAYPADFHAVVDQARAERGRNYLPPLKPVNVDLSKYQRIFLGFPFGVAPFRNP